MKIFLVWITTIFLITVVALLVRYFIEKYFDSKKGRFDADKSNYISFVALGIILTAFILLNPNTNVYLINILVGIINIIFKTALDKIDYQLDVKDIVLYSLLDITIIIILYISYKHRYIKFLEIIEKQIEFNKKEKIIRFPEQITVESPNLHERIKEIFELKFKRYELQICEKKDDKKNKVLYGYYQDDFNTIFEIIYCDIQSSEVIFIEKINSVYEYLNEYIFKEISKDKKNPISHFYYISENAKFAESPGYIKCQKEDEFFNNIIDFKNYLRKLINNFNNEKLFSALLSDNDKKTLGETFIEPSFIIGDKKIAKENLYVYIKDWMKIGSNSKHLVLLCGYGMGKTSFMKSLAAKLAHEILTDNEISRFPVYISLTNTSPIHGGIYKSIQSFVAENLGVEYELFIKLVNKGKILFILDAFDEMGFIGTNQQRFKQFNEIWQLATKNNKILLSGRPSYFPSEFELMQTLAIPEKGHEVIQTQPYAEKIVLQELDEYRIIKFIEKYYFDEAKIYFDWIKKDDGLYELCKRPSMMHIIREMLPELYTEYKKETISAGKLMNKYVEYWINRQKSKNIQSAFEGSKNSKFNFITEFFTDLSIKIYLSDKLTIGHDEIIEFLNEKIKLYNIESLESKENLEGFQQEIISGYFTEREIDEFKFVHKSFFEFFIAKKIIELIKQKCYNHPLMYKKWSLEIIDFMYDVIPHEYKNNEKYPALLLLSSNKFKAFWGVQFCKISKMFYLSLYYVLGIFPIIFIALCIKSFILLFIPNKAPSNIISNPVNGFIILFFIVICFLFIFIIEKLNKITQFTYKTIIISVSKNELCKKSILRLLFGSSRLIIKLNDFIFYKIQTGLSLFFMNSNLQNIGFNSCKFKIVKFEDCNLDNIDFQRSNFFILSFENCNLNNIKLENITFKENFFDRINLLWYLLKSVQHDRLIRLKNLGKDQIDYTTINSLKALIKKNKFELDKHIIADEWLIEILKKDEENALNIL